MKSKLATVSASFSPSKHNENADTSKTVEKQITTPVPSASKGIAARAAALLDRVNRLMIIIRFVIHY
jgi:hypothetical protein